MPSDWTRDEVELIVAEYFAMLEAELSGQAVNKAERNRRLQKELGRSKGSIEFTHANISAVLLNLGDLPYIDGYKPRSNYQQLEQVVLEPWRSSPTSSSAVRPDCRSIVVHGYPLTDRVENVWKSGRVGSVPSLVEIALAYGVMLCERFSSSRTPCPDLTGCHDVIRNTPINFDMVGSAPVQFVARPLGLRP
jgi:hypothetical protein